MARSKTIKVTKKLQRSAVSAPENSSPGAGGYSREELPPALDAKLSLLKKVFDRCEDVIFREFKAGTVPVALIYVDGMVNEDIVNNNIIHPLMLEFSRVMPPDRLPSGSLGRHVRDHLVAVAQVREEANLDLIITEVLGGKTAILIDGYIPVIVASTAAWEMRNVEEPKVELAVRGPREGFTESLKVNTTLVRRRLKDPALKFRHLEIGRRTHTRVAIAYIEGIAREEIVREVEERLRRIDIDGVIDTGTIEEFVEDAPYSPFPTVKHTERPDKVCADLLEGRVGVLVDGSPFCLIVPSLFVEHMQSMEDYFERPQIQTLIRFIRYASLGLALTGPSLYIAITTFHQDMIPTALLINLAGAREAVPFPSVVEALIMEFTFEALREAGARMPRAIGQAVSIVGALVLGQAAVQAGLVSPAMVIVVAGTAIASFTIAGYSLAAAIRFLRFGFMVLAATLGLYGIILGFMFLVGHLVSLRSFRVPYLFPLAPGNWASFKDSLIRAYWWQMDSRPELIAGENLVRQQNHLKPGPGRGRKQGEDR